MDSDERKNIIEIWKAVVGVQQHFNEIEMRIRGLFITMVVAMAAAQGFLIEKKLSVPLGSFTIIMRPSCRCWAYWPHIFFISWIATGTTAF